MRRGIAARAVRAGPRDLHCPLRARPGAAPSCPMDLIPSPERVSSAAANAFDMVFRGGVADLRRTPAQIISEAPKRVVYRYLPPNDERPARPAGAARAAARRAERLLRPAPRLLARRAPDRRRPPDLPRRVRRHRASPTRTSGSSSGSATCCRTRSAPSARTPAGEPVQLLGWCLGGIMSLLALAGDESLPVASVALVASPFDFRAGAARWRRSAAVANITNGFLGTTLYRALGGAPAPLVKRAFQLTSIDKYLTKPIAIGDPPARPRLARAGRGGRRVHGPDARLPGPHDGPALPPLLPHQRARRGHARPRRRGRRDPPRRRARPGARRSPGSADVLAPRPAVHHIAKLLPERAAGADRDGARRPPRRARRAAAPARSTWAWIDDFFADTARHAPRGCASSRASRISRRLTPPACGGVLAQHAWRAASFIRDLPLRRRG